MLTAFVRAFRTPDLRRKLLFTLFIIAMFRLGATVPTPGISEKAVDSCLNVVNTTTDWIGRCAGPGPMFQRATTATNSAMQAASPASESRLGRPAATVYSSTRIPRSAKVGCHGLPVETGLMPTAT